MLLEFQGESFRVYFDAARAKAHPGTGKWLIDGDDFKEWKSKERSILWLSGIRGFSGISL